MTNEELKAIRSRAGKATPGPWAWDRRRRLRSPRGRTVAALDAAVPTRGPDRTFIAAARLDVPNLLGQVEELAALLGDLQEDTQQLTTALGQLTAVIEHMRDCLGRRERR